MSDDNDALFEDFNWDAVSSTPNQLPDAKHAGYVTEAKVIDKKEADKEDQIKRRALIITYSVGEGSHRGKKIQDWKTLPKIDSSTRMPASERDKNLAEWLKQRLLQIGIKEEELKGFTATDIVGRPVYFTTKQNGTFRNVTFVEPRDESDSGGDFANII